MEHRRRLSLAGSFLTLFEATVEREQKAQFRNNFACNWFKSSEEALPETAITYLKHHNRWKSIASLIHDDISDLLVPMHGSGRTTFQGQHSTDHKGPCFAFLISDFCNTSAAKEMFAVNHTIAVRTPCVRHLTPMDAIRNIYCGRPWTLFEIKLAS